MKRTKMLALTLVVAIMLAGAGFAAWTDEIVYNTTIDTGEFDVTFARSMWAKTIVDYVPGSPFESAGLRDNFSVADKQHNTFIITPSDDNKSIDFRFHNAYPGTKMHAQVWAKNNGTLPAVIDKVIVDYKIKDEVTGQIKDNSKLEEAMKIDYNYSIKPEGSPWSPDDLKESGKDILLGDLNDVLNDRLRGKVLLPGEEFGGGLSEGEDERNEWAPFNFTFKIPEDSLFFNEAENEILEISITYKYVQHNVFK